MGRYIAKFVMLFYKLAMFAMFAKMQNVRKHCKIYPLAVLWLLSCFSICAHVVAGRGRVVTAVCPNG